MPWSIDDAILNIDDGNLDLNLLNQGYEKPTTDDVVRQILNKDGIDLDKVTGIYLKCCSRITDEALTIIAEKCSRLEILDVTHCLNVTDEAIRRVLQSNPNMKELYFSWCKKVTVNILSDIVTHTPNVTWIVAGDVGWSAIPENIDFDKLKKLGYFNLQYNGIKKLPKSMANLPFNCHIYIKDNPLESPPIKMSEYGSMPPATIGRFYAGEEMCKLSDFTLEMMDTNIKECGVKNIDVLQEICRSMQNTIRSNKSLSTVSRQECMERVAVVREDKKLIKNLRHAHEGKTGRYLHAVCRSYCVTPEVIKFCLSSFGKECASKRNAGGLTPLQCLNSNPMATDECRNILNPRGVNANVTEVHSRQGGSLDAGKIRQCEGRERAIGQSTRIQYLLQYICLDGLPSILNSKHKHKKE